MTSTQAAKHLQTGPYALRDWMLRHRWLYRSNGNLLAYQSKIDAGHLIHKLVDYTNGKTGAITSRRQVLVTQRGTATLAREYQDGKNNSGVVAFSR